MNDEKDTRSSTNDHSRLSNVLQSLETFIAFSVITFIFSSLRDSSYIPDIHPTLYVIIWMFSYPSFLYIYRKYR